MNRDSGSSRDADATQILRARARALARPPVVTTTAETLIEVIEFRVARESYAVETRYVGEVCPLKNLCPLPGTPPFVRGIVSVRGRIVPVLDLRQFFELPGQGLTDLHRIILVQGNELEFGLLADVVVGTRALALETLQPSLPTLTGIRAEYLKGVTAERLVVLEMSSILNDSRIVVHQEVEN